MAVACLERQQPPRPRVGSLVGARFIGRKPDSESAWQPSPGITRTPTIPTVTHVEVQSQHHANFPARLFTCQTKADPEQRYAAKWRLAKLLYERKWHKQRITDLFSVIDRLMRLPPAYRTREAADTRSAHTGKERHHARSSPRPPDQRPNRPPQNLRNQRAGHQFSGRCPRSTLTAEAATHAPDHPADRSHPRSFPASRR